MEIAIGLLYALIFLVMAVITTRKNGVSCLAHANWRTSACASASERNLLAVARLTAAHAWLMRWAVLDGAIALLV